MECEDRVFKAIGKVLSQINTDVVNFKCAKSVHIIYSEMYKLMGNCFYQDISSVCAISKTRARKWLVTTNPEIEDDWKIISFHLAKLIRTKAITKDIRNQKKSFAYLKMCVELDQTKQKLKEVSDRHKKAALCEKELKIKNDYEKFINDLKDKYIMLDQEMYNKYLKLAITCISDETNIRIKTVCCAIS